MKRLIEKLKTWFLTPPPPDYRVALKIEFGGICGDPTIVSSHSWLDIRRDSSADMWTAKQTGEYHLTNSLVTKGTTPMSAILNWIEEGLQRCPGLVNWIRAMNNIDKLVILSEPKVAIEQLNIEIAKMVPHADDRISIFDEPHIDGRGSRGDPTIWSFTRYKQEDGRDIAVLRSEESSADHPWAGAHTGIGLFREAFSLDEERALFYALAGWIRKSFQEAIERDASGEQKMAFLYKQEDGDNAIHETTVQPEGLSDGTH